MWVGDTKASCRSNIRSETEKLLMCPYRDVKDYFTEKCTASEARLISVLNTLRFPKLMGSFKVCDTFC